jgi:nucleotide-binding universal stress UspA family protein
LDSIATAAAVPMRTHALPGEPAEAIVRVAEEVGADLIVVGNKGLHGVRRVLGSVPNTVVHQAPCSVLVLDTT